MGAILLVIDLVQVQAIDWNAVIIIVVGIIFLIVGAVIGKGGINITQ